MCLFGSLSSDKMEIDSVESGPRRALWFPVQDNLAQFCSLKWKKNKNSLNNLIHSSVLRVVQKLVNKLVFCRGIDNLFGCSVWTIEFFYDKQFCLV